MTQELLKTRHVKYFKMCLGILPARVQKEDSNKLLLVYCSVVGLSLLGYQFTSDERSELIDFVYKHLVPSKQGFRGSLSHEIPSGNQYDPATLANTYSALCILLTLGDDYLNKLDATKIMDYVSKCQLPDGSFLSILDDDGIPYGDGDLRQCYLAVSIRKLLKFNGAHDLNFDKLERHVLKQIQYDGGLGTFESHSGLTFCGLASLKLINRLNHEDEIWDKTKNWLVHRQLSFNEYNKELLEYEFSDVVDEGGFNGRENKFGDTCYAFWNIGSLVILNSERYIDASKCESYLSNVTQNKIVGGFAKSDADDPDPFHSFLALSALSLLKFDGLDDIDPVLVAPTQFTQAL